MNLKLHSRGSVLRWSIAHGYKRRRLSLPRTSPRVWGRGVVHGLGEGAKPDAPFFFAEANQKRMAAPKRAAILIMGRRAVTYQLLSARRSCRPRAESDQTSF